MKRRYLYLSMLAMTGCYLGQESACDFGKGPSGTPTPTPAASATPTPSPTPTPTPSPTPVPTPVPVVSCELPSKPDCGSAGCCTDGGSPLFNSQIGFAQIALRSARPDIFNADGSIKVEELVYTDLLARTLMAQNPGLCARAGTRQGDSISKDEIAIKSDNTVSQNVDVIIGGSNQPYVGGRYTCRPASF